MKKEIALTLSSGGARGIAQIGVIQEILNQGYTISSIAGASIGAVIGGLYAAGKLDEYTDWICNLNRLDVFHLMDLDFSGQTGLIQGKRVFGHLENWVGGMTIEELPMPYVAVASDMVNRKEIIFDGGDLLTAMRASVAIPGFLTPVIHNDDPLFDGGVCNPIPVNRIQKEDHHLHVAVDLNAYVEPDLRATMMAMLESTEEEHLLPFHMQGPVFEKVVSLVHKYSHLLGGDENENEHDKKSSLSYFSTMNHMFDMMQEQLSSYILRDNPPDVLIKIPRDLCSTFDFDKSRDLVEIGRLAARETLKQLENSTIAN
ncbi:patatin-like phospholipase family protein [Halosquirtibacter xylanolyticus]|uniref:patatin-like phospholipase family protein n=1 Tax=Halosquirtibacter xylanolyticus TaxID=3374599 RepID=UPI00374A7A45|nr:patatin-like phospholipase family protein [Prolixibacteraceae bacterium]